MGYHQPTTRRRPKSWDFSIQLVAPYCPKPSQSVNRKYLSHRLRCNLDGRPYGTSFTPYHRPVDTLGVPRCSSSIREHTTGERLQRIRMFFKASRNLTTQWSLTGDRNEHLFFGSSQVYARWPRPCYAMWSVWCGTYKCLDGPKRYVLRSVPEVVCPEESSGVQHPLPGGLQGQ